MSPQANDGGSRFVPRLEVLPPHQLALWPELTAVPRGFVLYGGTALALRLGHRASVDFDFFRTDPFAPEDIERAVPWLREAEKLQSMANILTVSIRRKDAIKLSFLGGLEIGRAGTPDRASDNGLWVASLLDLAATRMAVVQQRAEKKDYLDVSAILKAGVPLADALGAAMAVHGPQFNPAITLKALAFFGDGDLPALPESVQKQLAGEAARFVEPTVMARASDRLIPGE